MLVGPVECRGKHHLLHCVVVVVVVVEVRMMAVMARPCCREHCPAVMS